MLCAFLAFQVSAGKPECNPGESDCRNAELATFCTEEIEAASDLAGGLISNAENVPAQLSHVVRTRRSAR